MQESSISEALKAGMPITCASCPLLHEGNGQCGKTKCGGPGKGLDFPDYAGPIPRELLVERCLVCGSGEVNHLILGLPTKFSLCEAHKNVYAYVGQDDPEKIKLPVAVIVIPK